MKLGIFTYWQLVAEVIGEKTLEFNSLNTALAEGSAVMSVNGDRISSALQFPGELDISNGAIGAISNAHVQVHSSSNTISSLKGESSSLSVGGQLVARAVSGNTVVVVSRAISARETAEATVLFHSDKKKKRNKEKLM